LGCVFSVTAARKVVLGEQ